MLTPTQRKALDTVNDAVNADTHYVNDMDLYRLPDFWSRLDKMKRGDCEDTALEKRFRLHDDHGVSYDDMDILLLWIERIDPVTGTVTRGEGEYHAVLVVSYAGEDWMMDNRRYTVVPISEARKTYQFDKIQDRTSATGWKKAS